MSSLPITAKAPVSAIPIKLLLVSNYAAWLKKKPLATQRWLRDTDFVAKAGAHALLPDEKGSIGEVICLIDQKPDTWSIARLATTLPANTYTLAGSFSRDAATQMALGWTLSGYRFTRYKKYSGKLPVLVAPKGCDLKYVTSMASAFNWARDLINTPAGDMHPAALAKEAADWAKSAGADVTVIKGEALLKANYPTVYTVGKAAEYPAHLVDIRFGRKGAPKVTLVGKGVCFDSGGLDIKGSSNMKLMKKDMAGVAIMLALARVLVETKTRIQLRLILPIAENAIAGNAMHPLDIVKTRKGITVEIGNTDAEGRLLICDALAAADEEEPDLLIDCTTLTGAARVALGTDMPAFFTPDDKLADKVARYSAREHDPMWRLPLWKPYRSFLDSPVADLSNDPDSGYGGAITAALYLQEFVSKTASWLHLDMMAWNLSAKPGRPQGGEAMAIRALYALIRESYGHG